MKKLSTRNTNRITFILSLMIMLGVAVSEHASAQATATGQSKEILLSEDFSAGLVPPAGWTVEGGGNSSWALYQSNDAGGEIPEMYYQGWIAFTGTSRMVSPEINTAGIAGLIVEWKHKILNSSNPNVTLKVETTSDGTTWNEVWIWSSTGFIGPETTVLPITNSDVGSENFRFALTFEGSAGTGFNSWRVDDIVLSTLSANDVAASVLHLSPQIPAGSTVVPRVLVENMANDTVSFPVLLEIEQNSSVIYTSEVQVEDLGAVESVYLSFDAWDALEGDYSATVTTLLDGDTDPTNDAISINIEVTDDVAWKKPLYEVFTSSTCGPCTGVNEHLDALFEENAGEYSLIKHQMDWPAPGDPYFNEQSNFRKDYYGVTGIPDMYENGTNIPGAIVYSQFDMNEISLDVSKLVILIDEENTVITGDGTVSIHATLEAMQDYAAGLKLYTVVVEKTTYGNTGNNGETEFHNVMMVTLPGAEGETLGPITAGETLSISETYDMTATFMEEATDLAVVIFVQDDTDKALVQSEMKDIGMFVGLEEASAARGQITVFPNPARSQVIIESPGTIQRIRVFNANNEKVHDREANASSLRLSTQAFPPGVYVVLVETAGGTFAEKLVICR